MTGRDIVLVVCLLLLGGINTLASDKGLEHGGTIVEIKSQGDTARLMESIISHENATAYLLIPLSNETSSCPGCVMQQVGSCSCGWQCPSSGGSETIQGGHSCPSISSQCTRNGCCSGGVC
jgi:hypothetical protein